MCVRACVRGAVRACVRACVCACVRACVCACVQAEVARLRAAVKGMQAAQTASNPLPHLPQPHPLVSRYLFYYCNSRYFTTDKPLVQDAWC